MWRRSLALTAALALIPSTVSVQSPHAGAPTPLAGLIAAAQSVRDTNDIVHITASNAHDAYFLQGWVHAQDRLFQIDYSRRQASGTLAELLGPAALPTDVQLRTFGLRRAAEATLPVVSAETRSALAAYAQGVNAYLAANPTLPPEYAALGVTRFEPWTALDSAAVAKLIAFGLSFDLGDIDRTVTLFSYQAAGTVMGFDGTKLFFDDLFRSAPFDPASTVPDASIALAASSLTKLPRSLRDGASLRPDRDTAVIAKRFTDGIKGMPLVERYLKRDRRPNSNQWALGPAHTESGRAMFANDPHLALDIPSVWYPVHQRVSGSLDVIGTTFPGVPFVVLGHNRRISWGATVNPLDVTDVFSEQIVPDPRSPSGFSTLHEGALEPIIPIPEVFKANINGVLTTVMPGAGVPAFTLVVPRRNGGPIIQLDQATGRALSVAFTGFGPTRELDTFRLFDLADDLGDFRAALSFFDFGSQNFGYADSDGNIAYFAGAEMPVRTDLQAETVIGLPPYFIREGTIAANDWLPVQHPQPNQALPFEILSADEMPHIVNPPAGWFVNANNDPIGTTLDNDPINEIRSGGGVYYLSPAYDGFRAGRATQLIRGKVLGGGKVSFEDMRAMQADTTMIDAQFFVPYILQAFANAQGSNSPMLQGLAYLPAVQDAVRRLHQWNLATPTGIPEGYDAVRSVSDPANSVAATIYAVWRGQFIDRVVDSKLKPSLPTPDDQEVVAGLRHLLETFATNQGFGDSGFPFLYVPGETPANARDIYILSSLARGMTLLAGPDFAPAFNNSSNPDDYRWGLLHRIVLKHPLDSVFNVPPAGGALPSPIGSLPGFPVDGGFETLDRSDHDARAARYDQFMFDHGPSKRSAYEGVPGGMRGVSSLPGGVSGVLGSPYYANLLSQWLHNEAYPQLQGQDDLAHETLSVHKFVPR